MSRRKQLNPKPVHKDDADTELSSINMTSMTESEEGYTSRRSSLDDMESSNERFSSQSLSNCSTPSPSPRSPSAHPVSLVNLSTEPIANIINSTTRSPVLQIKQEPDENVALPKLRLNAILAADPALQPFAKDIKHTEAQRIDGGQSDDEIPTESIQPISLTPPSSFVPTNFEELIHRNGGRPSNIKTDTLALAARSGFTCDPCGIKFSSLSTLEAHQTYYCSHSRKNTDEVKSAPAKPAATVRIASANSAEEPPPKISRMGKQYACTHCSYSADKKVSLNRHMRMHQTSPAISSGTSNNGESTSDSNLLAPQTECYCCDCDIRFSSLKTYRAHKQHYCSGRRSGASNKKSNSRSQSPVEVASTPPSVVSTPTPQPYLALPTNPIVIIPYSLIRTASVLPGPLSTISPNAADPDQTCFLLKNGALQAFAHSLTMPTTSPGPLSISPPRVHSSELERGGHPDVEPLTTEIVSKIAPKKMETNSPETNVNPKKDISIKRPDASTPLDLSVRRLSIDQTSSRDRSDSLSSTVSGHAPSSGRVSIEIRHDTKDGALISPEHIVCAPSLPGSPPQTPSPKLSLQSPRSMLSASPVSSQIASFYQSPGQHQSMILRQLLPSDVSDPLSTPDRQAIMAISRRMSIARSSLGKKSSPGPPQMYVKQGVSKCKECNIVFCKYENYLAHKKHYCSARDLPDADRPATVTPPSISPGAVPPKAANNAPPSLPYQQLICAACGIKFTSLDNLNAHQMYYCPKRIELTKSQEVVERKCTKCRTHHDPAKTCPLNHNLYKCPICDVVSTNAAESKRHLDTHTGVKAFRCSICQYRGNTLRGMRTHIRMHFEKKTSDFNEEHYITCILEENGVELTPPTVKTTPKEERDSAMSEVGQIDLVAPSQLHSCDECNYSSTYKGNVVRHVKLVHSASYPLPTSSPRLGEGGESLLLTHPELVDTTKVSAQKAPYSVNFKAEPLADRPDNLSRTSISSRTPCETVHPEPAVSMETSTNLFNALTAHRNASSTTSVT